MNSLAALAEEFLARRKGVILDDRRQPLFEVGQKLRDNEKGTAFAAKVVDKELLEQGAPADVVLHFLPLHESISPAIVARALEPCLVDHPRIQLTHSVALSQKALAAVQPAEPSPLVPPLHWLPICDELSALILVKEYSEGMPLLKWRSQRGTSLKLTDISDLVETISEAIANLHRRGFSHGALTPESIVLQDYDSPTMGGSEIEQVWVPKIVDLGLSRTLAAPGRWPTGQTSLWAPPESFQADALTDWRRVDQLGLAALLYALWTNRIPFEAIGSLTPPEDARKIRRQQIEALPPPRGNTHARDLGVTPAMSAACMRALSAEPNDRFPSLDAFAGALRAASRERLRKSDDDGDEDPADNTSPASSITSRFRALTGKTTDSAKVRVHPEAHGQDPAAVVTEIPEESGDSDEPSPAPDQQAKAEKKPTPKPPVKATPPPVDDTAEALTEPPPARVYAPPPVADIDEDVKSPDDAWAGMETVRDVTKAADKHRDADIAMDQPTERGEPSADLLAEDREKARKTQILSHPDEPSGEYPEHPDVTEAREAGGTDPDIAAVVSDSQKWQLNSLAKVFLGLWLATLVWAVVATASGPKSPPERPAPRVIGR